MSDHPVPFPAATVVLARPDRDGGFEVFMNRRPAYMDTYAGIYVFPGGRVEPADTSERIAALTQGLSADQAQRLLGSGSSPGLCRGYWVAAVRELFEEAGIHFFGEHRADGATGTGTPLITRLAEKRELLQRGGIDFADLLESEHLDCDLSRLSYFYHRITPEHYPVRFDTRFYLAALPAGQMPIPHEEEVAESLWIAPKDALQRSAAGSFPIMPPTSAVLRMLAEHGSWEAVSAAFRLR